MNIGNRIKEYRKKANLTQKELAKKIDKSERMVQKYESNDVIPSIDMIDKLVEALNISWGDLMDDKRLKENLIPELKFNQISDKELREEINLLDEMRRNLEAAIAILNKQSKVMSKIGEDLKKLEKMAIGQSNDR